ncbi:MAG TPA: choice-of-anchor L domain-containing protein, partial [Flavobacterium sp.]|nr:choice-of-anchor L domain-containing protein [Flavobacterium sp.]
MEGTNLTWYAEPSLTTELAEDTEAEDGVTYYVTQTNGTCVSEPLAITVTLDYPAITVSPDQYSVEELVEDVLIDSPCAFVDNISWSTGTNFGQPNGIGYFENTNPLFPMEKGIVLATGNVNQVPGPWTGTDLAGTWAGDDDLFDYIQDLGIDPELDDYNEATIIEFDFQANSDQMSFNFLFASREYGTYQCSFADAFAFFLTNTETGLTTNLALVPGTDDPISVLTIRDAQWNNGNNGTCSDGNPASMNEEYFGIYNAENATTQSQAAINFHGQTTKITASSEVEPGIVYHIKLVIANRNDSGFDSAIFIEGGSFEIGAPDLGGDKLIVDDSALCSGDPYVLDTQLSADEYVFHWFRDGLPIPGESGPSLEVTESGTYSVDIVPIGVGCNENPEPVVIEIYNPVVENFPPANLSECRTAGEFTYFNLVTAMQGVNESPDVEETYYLSEQDAESQ